MNMTFDPTRYCARDYLSMLGLKLHNDSERGPEKKANKIRLMLIMIHVGYKRYNDVT